MANLRNIPGTNWLGRYLMRNVRGRGLSLDRQRGFHRGGGEIHDDFTPYSPPRGYIPDLSQMRGRSRRAWDVHAGIYGFTRGAGAYYRAGFRGNFVSAFFEGVRQGLGKPPIRRWKVTGGIDFSRKAPKFGFDLRWPGGKPRFNWRGRLRKRRPPFNWRPPQPRKRKRRPPFNWRPPTGKTTLLRPWLPNITKVAGGATTKVRGQAPQTALRFRARATMLAPHSRARGVPDWMNKSAQMHVRRMQAAGINVILKRPSAHTQLAGGRPTRIGVGTAASLSRGGGGAVPTRAEPWRFQKRGRSVSGSFAPSQTASASVSRLAPQAQPGPQATAQQRMTAGRPAAPAAPMGGSNMDRALRHERALGRQLAAREPDANRADARGVGGDISGTASNSIINDRKNLKIPF